MAHYPADTFQEATELAIEASNQLHSVINGDANAEVTVEDGSKIPSVRKAYTDSLFFLSPQPWVVGGYETVYNQLRAFVEPTGITTWWFSKPSAVSTPVLMSTTPHEDSNWTLWNAINNSVYETQKRLAAEAGLNMVGSFLLGATVTTTDDVVFYETDGKYYSWGGSLSKVVSAGSTPAGTSGVGAGAWVDRTDVTLRDELKSSYGASNVGTDGGLTVQGILDNLIDGQNSGVIVFQTYALLDAYTPANTTEEKGSFKVANDPDSSKNGYYAWVSGTSYIKDASLVVNTIDENNTSDAVSGHAVAEAILTDPDRVNIRENLGKSNLLDYRGGIDPMPLIVDIEGNILMSVSLDGKVNLNISDTEKNIITDLALKKVSDKLEELNSINYASDDIVPIIVDKTGKVVLGYDNQSSSVVGAFQEKSIQKDLPDAYVIDDTSIHQFISYGQSLSVGIFAGSVLTTTQPYNNISWPDGPRGGPTLNLTSFVPLVETTTGSIEGSISAGETICSGAANTAITLGLTEGKYSANDAVILATAAGHGGYSIDSLKKGTTWYNTVFLAHVQAAYALNNDLCVAAISWMQGEADSGKTKDQYKELLRQLRIDMDTDIKAITGQNSPVHLITYQMAYGVNNASDSTVAVAQFELSNEDDLIHIGGPMYIYGYYGDGIHITSKSQRSYGDLVGSVLKELMFDRKYPSHLKPISAYTRYKKVTVTFPEWHLPLVFDDSILIVQDNGFKLTDTTGDLNITGSEIINGNVAFTVDRLPDSDVTIRYGLDYVVTRVDGGVTRSNGGCGGTLRDSFNKPSVSYSLPSTINHWAPTFEMVAKRLEF